MNSINSQLVEIKNSIENIDTNMGASGSILDNDNYGNIKLNGYNFNSQNEVITTGSLTSGQSWDVGSTIPTGATLLFSSPPTQTVPLSDEPFFDSHFFNDNNKSFYESNTLSSGNIWRIAYTVTKSSNQEGLLSIRLFNPLPPSTFSLTSSTYVNQGVTTFDSVAHFYTIGDNLSIRGAGKAGYKLVMSVNGMTVDSITINSIVRHSGGIQKTVNVT